MATAAAGNWNNPDCGVAYINARASVLHPPTSVHPPTCVSRTSGPMRFGGFGGAAHYRGHTNCHICKCTRIFESNCTQEGSQGLCSVLGAWPGDSEVNQHFFGIHVCSRVWIHARILWAATIMFPMQVFYDPFVLKSWNDNQTFLRNDGRSWSGIFNFVQRAWDETAHCTVTQTLENVQ